MRPQAGAGQRVGQIWCFYLQRKLRRCASSQCDSDGARALASLASAAAVCAHTRGGSCNWGNGGSRAGAHASVWRWRVAVAADWPPALRRALGAWDSTAGFHATTALKHGDACCHSAGAGAVRRLMRSTSLWRQCQRASSFDGTVCVPALRSTPLPCRMRLLRRVPPHVPTDDATGGSGWTANSGWGGVADACDWAGVSCTFDGVTAMCVPATDSCHERAAPVARLLTALPCLSRCCGTVLWPTQRRDQQQPGGHRPERHVPRPLCAHHLRGVAERTADRLTARRHRQRDEAGHHVRVARRVHTCAWLSVCLSTRRKRVVSPATGLLLCPSVHRRTSRLCSTATHAAAA